MLLHGLFASSRNYHSNALALSKLTRVHAIDLRNHGESFHAPEHSVRAMTEDVRRYILENQLTKPVILGHSMGGFVAMSVALDFPFLISGIIVADIAPKKYDLNYERELSALSEDYSQCETRKEAEAKMAKIIPEIPLRQFLMMNLRKSAKGGFECILNLDAIREFLRDGASRGAFISPGLSPSKVPALFIRALKSPFVSESDCVRIRSFFPNARIVEIDADHWLHFSAADEFNRICADFIESVIRNP